MTELNSLTAQQIAERLRRDDLSAATLQGLVHSIAARRRAIKARLDEIENRNGAARRAAVESYDPAQIALLNRECETLDDETTMLCSLESRIYQLHTRAADGELAEAARKARKGLPQIIDRAGDALKAYEEARSALSAAVDAIGAVPHGVYVTAEDFERIAAALFPATLVRGEHLRGARHGLRGRICAPLPPTYGTAAPDFGAQLRDVMTSPFQRRGS